MRCEVHGWCAADRGRARGQLGHVREVRQGARRRGPEGQRRGCGRGGGDAEVGEGRLLHWSSGRELYGRGGRAVGECHLGGMGRAALRRVFGPRRDCRQAPEALRPRRLDARRVLGLLLAVAGPRRPRCRGRRRGRRGDGDGNGRRGEPPAPVRSRRWRLLEFPPRSALSRPHQAHHSGALFAGGRSRWPGGCGCFSWQPFLDHFTGPFRTPLRAGFPARGLYSCRCGATPRGGDGLLLVGLGKLRARSSRRPQSLVLGCQGRLRWRAEGEVQNKPQRARRQRRVVCSAGACCVAERQDGRGVHRQVSHHRTAGLQPPAAAKLVRCDRGGVRHAEHHLLAGRHLRLRHLLVAREGPQGRGRGGGRRRAPRSREGDVRAGLDL
mmetsp:Transcript_110323/g.351666  ORF Transcript_110323/g.351666 Transcript_110323/m.351666 type:complete len:382 (+) Transcript_110323:236-1381(+)